PRQSCGPRSSGDANHVLKEWSGALKPPMIVAMTTMRRHQRRYDHRLRDLVQRTGDATIATNLGVPRSTARGWVRSAPKAVVSLDVANLNGAVLQREVFALRLRVKKLRALLRLTIDLRGSWCFALMHQHL